LTASGSAVVTVSSGIESPVASGLSFPWLEISGWALGQQGPIRSVELFDRGQLCRRIPVDRPRPDLAQAFRDVPWAARAGFAARVSLVGTGGAGDLDLRAILPDGESGSIGRITGQAAKPPPAPVVVVLDAGEQPADAQLAVLAQASPASCILTRHLDLAAGHPGFIAIPNWNQVLDRPDSLLWLCDGNDDVTDDFLTRAVDALIQRPEVSFAVAVEPHPPQPGSELVGALNGTRLGSAILFRTSAIRTIGGIDEAAESAVRAQWDLAVRLAEAGHRSVEIFAVPPAGVTLTERAGAETVRWVYRKHARVYQRNFRELLRDCEAETGRLLQANDIEARDLEEDLRPRLRSRRRERDRLSAKLRPPADEPAHPHHGLDDWGDLRRLEPVSPAGGSERGLPIDRYYLERFLRRHKDDLTGTVLEIRDAADLTQAPEAASESCDCLILVDVLRFVEDPATALTECHRVLRPGGVLLASVAAAARVDSERPDRDYWRFSPHGFRRLLERTFDPAGIEVRAEGNRRAVIAFLAGLAGEEVGTPALDSGHLSTPLIVTARAVRADPGDET
jgi:SAM-dependent methyltransferase